MIEVTTADQVLLALAGTEDPDGSIGESASVVGLSDALETSAESMADRVSLLSTLSELDAEGLIESQTTGERTTYALTDRGSERAAEVRDRLVERTITVENSHQEQIPLGEVDRYLEAPALPRALARLTDDGTVYLDDEVDRRFVDREAELDRLEGHLDRAREAGGRAVLVAGEPGVGKTTLLEEFLDRREEALVLSGVCRSDTAEPYHAVRTAVEPHLTDSPFDRPGVDPDDADALSDMRTALFADVADAVLELAAGRPVVLFLDDLDVVDGSTLSLLEFLVDRISEGPVLLVGTYRPVELGDDEREGFPWGDDAVDDRIELDPFGVEETRGLVEWLVGTRRVPGAFVELVQDHTGGVPLFVGETVTRLLDRGEVDPAHDLYPGDASAVPLPEAAEDAIDRRLAALDDSAQRIVRTAALLGEPFAVDVLAAAVAVEREALREYLDLLVDAGLFEPTGDDHLRFASGLVREVIVERVPDGERAALHREIAASLTTVVGEDPERAAAVAAHLERAGERDRALVAWFDAARHAESVYAHEKALAAYERALELARETGNDRRVFDALEATAEIHRLLGDHDEAARTLRYVESEADAPGRRQGAARKLADWHNFWDDPDAALAAAERGLERADDAPASPEDVRLLLARAQAISQQGEMSRGRELFDRAVALAGDLDDPRLRARTLRRRAMAVRRQTPEAVDRETVEEMERAVELLREIADEATVAAALEDLAQLYSEFGNEQRGRELIEEALDRQRAIGDRTGAMETLHNLAFRDVVAAARNRTDPAAATAALERTREEATALGHEGLAVRVDQLEALHCWQGYHRGDRALARYEAVLERVRELELFRWEQGCHHILARLSLVVADDPDRASEHAEQLLELVRETDRPYHVLWGLTTLARIRRAAGDPGGASGHLDEAAKVAADIDAPLRELEFRVERVRVALATGDRETARAQLEAIDRIQEDETFDPRAEGEWGERRPSLAARAAGARVAAADGEHDSAIEGFGDALAAAREADDRVLACEFGLALARTCRAADELGRAREVLADTEELAADADYRRYERACRAERDRLDGDDPGAEGTADDT